VLENRWRFTSHEKGAHVRYWIAYEFKNPLLQAAISANKDKLANRIMNAFESEARRRLAKR
jgi:coenzyme Q-binding protein COQ10